MNRNEHGGFGVVEVGSLRQRAAMSKGFLVNLCCFQFQDLLIDCDSPVFSFCVFHPQMCADCLNLTLCGFCCMDQILASCLNDLNHLQPTLEFRFITLFLTPTACSDSYGIYTNS